MTSLLFIISSLILSLGLGVASPARAEIPGRLAALSQVGGSLSAGELARFSTAGLRVAEQRIARVGACLDASRVDQAVRAAGTSRKSYDVFALKRKIEDPVTLRIRTKQLHEKTIGSIRNSAFTRYSKFDDYFAVGGTGTRGKFFESQSVVQANSALKKQGSAARYALTAVEGDPGHAADVVLLDERKRIVERYQLKSTRSVNDIAAFASDPRYADMALVTHPETLGDLRRKLAEELQRAQRRGAPLPAKWLAVQRQLDAGRITDTLGAGKPVSSYEVTGENARRFRRYQWNKGQPRIQVAKPVPGALTKSAAMPKALSKTGLAFTRAAKGTLFVLETVAAPIDIGFAAYGYYDSFSRFSEGRLDQDLLAVKLGIHTTEAALGAAAAYPLGTSILFGLGLISAPEPVATKITGLVVLAGSVVVITADFAVDMIASSRDRARQQTLEALTGKERYYAVRADLRKKLRAVAGN